MSKTKTRKGFPSLLAFFLGFILAAVIFIGAAVGVGLYVVNMKIDDIDANKDEDGNYLFVNGDPSSGGAETVLDLVQKISDMAKSIDDITIGDVKALIPFVDNILGEFTDATGDYLIIEDGEIEAVKVTEFKIWLSDLIDKINVVGILKPAPDSPIVAYLCYKVTGIKNEGGVWSAKYKDDGGAVHDCVLTVENNVITQVVCDDGTEVPTVHVNHLMERVDGVMNELTIGEIMGADFPDDDMILSSVKDSTINTLADDMAKLTVQQLFADEVYSTGNTSEMGEEKAGLYHAVQTQPQQAFTFAENRIYYEKAADGDTFKLASGNGKVTAEEFQKLIEAGDTLYTLGEFEILYDAAFLYYEQTDETYTLINAGSDNAGRAEYREGLYTYGCPAPMWKLMLYVDEKETAYAIGNITVMIDNVTKNTKQTLIRDLHEAEILTFENPNDLETILTWKENVDGVPVTYTKKLGDMTLTELIAVVVLIAKNPTSILPDMPSP